jgi:hypothetical protein
MSDNMDNPVGKEIRFINSDYGELFRIPDGSHITIIKDDGEQLIRKCAYFGECHAQIGGSLYHIREFAERMEQNGSTYAPCPEPEIVHEYLITDRMAVRDKVFVMAHNPDAVQPWVTWQGRSDRPGWDWGHYWQSRSDAWYDYFKRADSERTGKPYDHTKLFKQSKSRDDAR